MDRSRAPQSPRSSLYPTYIVLHSSVSDVAMMTMHRLSCVTAFGKSNLQDTNLKRTRFRQGTPNKVNIAMITYHGQPNINVDQMVLVDEYLRIYTLFIKMIWRFPSVIQPRARRSSASLAYLYEVSRVNRHGVRDGESAVWRILLSAHKHRSPGL
jgi:hypothetical protein